MHLGTLPFKEALRKRRIHNELAVSKKTHKTFVMLLKVTYGVNVLQGSCYIPDMGKKKRGPKPGTQYKNIKRTKLGENIAAARRNRGMSQRELAARTGVSNRMISYYERESENIPAAKLQKIATVLKISPDHLLGYREDSDALGISRALLKRIEVLKRLRPDQQKVVLDVIDQMSGEKKPPRPVE
jgi:transcriptional regulator with XRE-family HTH domain